MKNQSTLNIETPRKIVFIYFLLWISFIDQSSAARKQTLTDSIRMAYQEYQMTLLQLPDNKSQLDRKRKRYIALKTRYLEKKPKTTISPSMGGVSDELGITGNATIPEIKECLLDAEDDTLWLEGFRDRLLRAIDNPDQMELEDLGLYFTPTYDNRVEWITDRDEFWQKLINALEESKQSIHIHLYGFKADEWGRSLCRLLIKKARQGVRIRLILDRFGARLSLFHRIQRTQQQAWLDSLTTAGGEIVYYSHPPHPTLGDYFHFDHRKYFIIDGHMALHTGYTVEQSMYTRMMDMAMLLEGSIVNQLQAIFFSNFLYNGGHIALDSAAAYFPSPESGENNNGVNGRILINAPGIQHPITQTLYREIDRAQTEILIFSPYFTENRIMNHLKTALARGVAVKLIIPANPENKINRFNTEYHLHQLSNAGATIYRFEGSDHQGRFHAKGLITDQSYACMGSCNMDSFSLYRNFEQNIEIRNMASVRQLILQIKRDILPYCCVYSPPTSRWQRIWLHCKGWLSELFDPFV